MLDSCEKELGVCVCVCVCMYGFPCCSVVKESACSAGDLGWEDPLQEGMATHSSILAWRIPMNRGAWWATVHGVAELTDLATKNTHQGVSCMQKT